MKTIIIDMRCWQAEPALPGQASWPDLFGRVRPAAGGLVGIADPDLPALPVEMAKMLDEVRPNGYMPGVENAMFINPAPLAGEPLFVARLLLQKTIHKVALVDPPQVQTGLMAAVGRFWLRYYDEIAPFLSWRPAVGEMRHNSVRKAAGKPAHVALISPLPPARTGIADFTAALAPALAARVKLSVISAQSSAPVAAFAHMSTRYDRVVVMMGNAAPFHGQMLEALRRYGGACICHDARLLGLYASHYGAEHAAMLATRESGAAVSSAEILDWNQDETKRRANFLEELAACAQPLILHTSHSARLLTERGLRARFLPFAIYRPWAAEALSAAKKQAARKRVGKQLRLAPDEKLIVSLGFVTPGKGLAAGLAAMAILRARKVKVLLAWVGALHCDLGFWQEQAKALGIAEAVVWTGGFADEAVYRDYILAADMALQLRMGGAGNISGALQDAIAAGLPAVANEDLAAGLASPFYVSRVADELCPQEIAAAMESLLAAPPATEAERASYTAAHDMNRYAEGLCEILGLV